MLENASGSVEAGVIDAKGPATCTAQAFSDGDPAVLALVRAAQLAREEETVPFGGPIYDAPEQGNHRDCEQDGRRLVRVSVETKSGHRLPIDHCMYTQPIAHQAGRAHALPTRQEQRCQIGKLPSGSGRRIVQTSALLANVAGKHTARTIARRSESLERPKSLFNRILCAPWNPKAATARS